MEQGESQLAESTRASGLETASAGGPPPGPPGSRLRGSFEVNDPRRESLFELEADMDGMLSVLSESEPVVWHSIDHLSFARFCRARGEGNEACI